MRRLTGEEEERPDSVMKVGLEEGRVKEKVMMTEGKENRKARSRSGGVQGITLWLRHWSSAIS